MSTAQAMHRVDLAGRDRLLQLLERQVSGHFPKYSANVSSKHKKGRGRQEPATASLKYQPVSPTFFSASAIAAWRAAMIVAEWRALEAAILEGKPDDRGQDGEADRDIERPVVRRLDADG